MKKAGMPLSSSVTLTYTEVIALQRLAYSTLADFIPGVTPYDVNTVIEFQQRAKTVRMVLTFDAMHDKEWSARSVAGMESQLERLTKIIADPGATKNQPTTESPT